MQAHWQYDAAAIVAGTIRGSSIIQDQRRSRLNARLVEALRTGVLQNASLNLLEVDDVCDHMGLSWLLRSPQVERLNPSPFSLAQAWAVARLRLSK